MYQYQNHLSQKYLKEQLTLGQEGKGVILEVKKTKAGEEVEAILYDGCLNEGDEVAILSTGNILPLAKESAEILRGKNISTRLISMPTVKPLDEDYLKKNIKSF